MWREPEDPEHPDTEGDVELHGHAHEEGDAEVDEPSGHLLTLQAGENGSVKCGIDALELKMMNKGELKMMNKGTQHDDLWTMMMIMDHPNDDMNNV